MEAEELQRKKLELERALRDLHRLPRSRFEARRLARVRVRNLEADIARLKDSVAIGANCAGPPSAGRPDAETSATSVGEIERSVEAHNLEQPGATPGPDSGPTSAEPTRPSGCENTSSAHSGPTFQHPRRRLRPIDALALVAMIGAFDDGTRRRR